MKLEFSKQKKNKNSVDIIPGEKRKNARFGIIKWCCWSTKKWKARNCNGKERSFAPCHCSFLPSTSLSINAYYEKLKPISNVNKEYIDEHESDSEILQYDSDEASVESEESDNEESLNLGRVFETSNEN